METIQGVRTKLLLVSNTHGAVRIPLAQSFNYTPKLTERTINEFDNLEAAQVVTTFDGVDCSFDYLDSDSKLVDAMFADVDPAATVVIDDPSNYQQVTVFANMKALTTGKIFSSVLVKACRAKGSPYTEPVKEEARITRDLSGTNALKIKGKAIQYDRILATGSSGFAQGATNAYTDIAFAASTPWAAALSKTAVIFDGASGYDLYVLKDGNPVTTGYTMTASGFTPTGSSGYSGPTVDEIWEVFYLYSDV